MFDTDKKKNTAKTDETCITEDSRLIDCVEQPRMLTAYIQPYTDNSNKKPVINSTSITKLKKIFGF